MRRNTKQWRRHGPPQQLMPIEQRSLSEIEAKIDAGAPPFTMARLKRIRRNKLGGTNSGKARKELEQARAFEIRALYEELRSAGVKPIGARLEEHFGVSRSTVQRALRNVSRTK